MPTAMSREGEPHTMSITDQPQRISSGRLLRMLALALTGCLALLLAGLARGTADAGAAAPQTWQVAVGAQSSDLAIQTMGFYPAHLTIDQGDSVTWTANSAEIHTVTFLGTANPCPTGSLCALPHGFDPGDQLQSTPQGGASYDGSSYLNSGVMTSATGDTGPLPPFVHVVKTYTLSFPATLAPGTYTYYCLVHGMAMKGEVTVQAAGTAYPHTQAEYDQQSRAQEKADIADGEQLWSAARTQAAKLTSEHGPTVLVGTMDDRAMVMRFIPDKVSVHVGEKVTFVSTSMGEPHTVTFGNDATGCGKPPCNPEAPWNVAKDAAGNLVANYPGHNGGFTGDPANLNSGLLLGAPVKATGMPNQLAVTFTKTGHEAYVCALHDFMGMVGSVDVTAAPAASGPSTAPLSNTGTHTGSLGLLAAALLAAGAALCLAGRRRTHGTSER